MAIIAITTSNSINVKPFRFIFLLLENLSVFRSQTPFIHAGGIILPRMSQKTHLTSLILQYWRTL